MFIAKREQKAKTKKQTKAKAEKQEQKPKPNQKQKQSTAKYGDVRRRAATYGDVRRRTATYGDPRRRTARYGGLGFRVYGFFMGVISFSAGGPAGRGGTRNSGMVFAVLPRWQESDRQI